MYVAWTILELKQPDGNLVYSKRSLTIVSHIVVHIVSSGYLTRSILTHVLFSFSTVEQH